VTEPHVKGSLKSPEFTPTQNGLKDFISYFAKIGLTVSMEEAVVRVEQPNGMETFMEELEKEKGESGFVNEEKYKELEDKYRYETLRRPLGNSTAFINLFLRLLSSRQEFTELFNKGVAEAMMISKQSENLRQAKGQKDTDLL
jgi:hypothetical protein